MKYSFLRPYGRVIFLFAALCLPLHAAENDDTSDTRGPAIAAQNVPLPVEAVDERSEIPVPSDDDITRDMPADLSELLGPMAGMDQNQLMGMLGGQGVDTAMLQELLGDLNGFGKELPPEAPPVPYDTFEEVVAAHAKEHAAPLMSPRDLELSYEGAESEAVEPLRSGEGKLLEKYHDFVTKTLAGKGKATMLLVAFIIYRQVTWIWREWWKESKRTPFLPQKHFVDRLMGVQYFPTNMGSIGGFKIPSYGFWTFDLGFRFFFSVTHLWMGVRSWWETTQHLLKGEGKMTPEQWNEHLSLLFIRMGSARKFFANPTYYGMNLSFGKQALLELALPFAYASFMSRDPLNHSILKKAFGGMANHTIQHLGLRAYGSYYENVSHTDKIKWFDRTLGVVRPSTIRDMAAILGSLAEHAVLGGGLSAKEVIGTRVIRLVYLYLVIGVLRTATRYGATRHLYALAKLVGKGLHKIGILSTNPLEELQHTIARKLEEMKMLAPGEPMVHSLSMLGYAFPGALVRAVRAEMTKQDLPLATYRSPRFVEALGKLDRLAPSDIFLLFFGGMQSLPMELVGNVQSIMNGITQEKRTAVFTAFFDEIVAEVCFNRDMPTCWIFTERIVEWLGSNLLTEIGTAVL